MNLEQRIRRVTEMGWGYIEVPPQDKDRAVKLAKKYGRCGGTTTVTFSKSDPEQTWLCTSRQGHTWDHFKPHEPELLPTVEVGFA